MKNTAQNANLADLVEDLQSGKTAPSLKTITAEPEAEKNKAKIISIPIHEEDKMTSDSLDGVLSGSLETDLICKKVTYIDPKIHEVLTMIKQKRGVPIGILLSYLAQEFIIKHKSELKTLYEQNDLLK